MAITTPSDSEARVAVRVLKGFRSEGGQEFLPGWVCGFGVGVAAELEALGLAVRVDDVRSIARTAVMQEGDVVTGAVASGLASSSIAPAPQPTDKTRRKKP